MGPGDPPIGGVGVGVTGLVWIRFGSGVALRDGLAAGAMGAPILGAIAPVLGAVGRAGNGDGVGAGRGRGARTLRRVCTCAWALRFSSSSANSHHGMG